MRTPGQVLGCLLHYKRENVNIGIKYYVDWKSSPIYDTLKQNDISMGHWLLGLYHSSWEDFPDTGWSTGAYILFRQGRVVDYSSFVP